MFELKNNNGLEVRFISRGAKLCSVLLPSGDGKTDILAGYDTEEEYIKGDEYFGSLIGRFANRISGGGFHIDGKKISLEKNEGPNHLHGGSSGFHTKDWEVEEINLEDYASAYKLKLYSEDGDEGYPGALKVEVIYALNDKNELLADMYATTDKPTVVSLTLHPYFNLAGPEKENVYDHNLQIFADEYTPLNNDAVPTGEIKNVEGSIFDFWEAKKLKNILGSGSSDEEILKWGGLDHNLILGKSGIMKLAAVLSLPELGRAMEIMTTQPGIQVYTAQHLDGSSTGKKGCVLGKHKAIALEPQNFPDAPNKKSFPNAVLRPGEKYHHQIIYRFHFD